MDNLQTKSCLKCHKSLHGRLDKKFCDAYCRNSYNNLNKGPDEQKMKLTNQAIRKNRRILKTLSPHGKVLVRRSVLEDFGFNFNHFSGLFHSSGSVYYMSHDYGFRALRDNGKEKVQIIQEQAYMKDYNPWKYLKN